jgi:hypothetical protein
VYFSLFVWKDKNRRKRKKYLFSRSHIFDCFSLISLAILMGFNGYNPRYGVVFARLAEAFRGPRHVLGALSRRIGDLIFFCYALILHTFIAGLGLSPYFYFYSRYSAFHKQFLQLLSAYETK